MRNQKSDAIFRGDGALILGLKKAKRGSLISTGKKRLQFNLSNIMINIVKRVYICTRTSLQLHPCSDNELK